MTKQTIDRSRHDVFEHVVLRLYIVMSGLIRVVLHLILSDDQQLQQVPFLCISYVICLVGIVLSVAQTS